jgi:hypothetical protein
LAVFAVVALGLFISHQLKPPFNRVNEKLPTMSVEEGSMVYCRMRYCDFRFPIPSGTHVVRTNIASGGFDTIDGTIDVMSTNGEPIDMHAYAELLRKKHFNLSPDYTGGISASSKEPRGGWIGAEALDRAVRIRFTYFGDY